MLIWSLQIALLLIVAVASQDEIKFHDPTEFGATDAKVKLSQKLKRHSFKGEDGFIDIEKERKYMQEHQSEVEKGFLDLDQLDDGKLLSHYFENFDLDQDGFVDGLELFKSKITMNENQGEEGTAAAALDIEDVMEELDEELRYYDDDNDGYVRYSEFRRHQIRRIGEKQQQQQTQQ